MTVWTPEQDAQLTELRLAGKSAREIAYELGIISRCAVLGRVKRLRDRGAAIPPLQGGDSPAAKAKRGTSRRGTQPTCARRKPAAPCLLSDGKILSGLRQTQRIYAPGKLIPFLLLKDTLCKFAVSGAGGHLDPFMFCGQEVALNSSYCPHHHAICNSVMPPIHRHARVAA